MSGLGTAIRLQDNGLGALGMVGLLAAATGLLAGIKPVWAVAAMLGVIFIVVVLLSLTAGLVLFITLTFLEASPLWIQGFSVTKAAGVMLVLGMLARVTIHQGRPEGRMFLSAYPAASYALALVAGWAALSVLWAEDSAAAYDSLYRWALVLSLFLIVFSAVRSRREALLVLGAFVAGTALTAAYGLVASPDFDDSGRLGSTVGDSNVFAGVLIAGMVLGLATRFARLDAPGIRAAGAATAGLCFVAFLFTGSRGGVIALAVVLLASVAAAGRGRRGLAMLGVITVGALGVAYFTTYAPPDIQERIVNASQGQVGESEARPTLWRIGWRMVEDEPLVGVGAGNFEPRSVDYLLEEPGALTRTDRIIDDPTVAHNAYLQVQAELGVVGLGLFLGILGFSLRATVLAARESARAGDRELRVLALGLALALVGFLVVNLFISEIFNKQLWLLLALGPALLAVVRESHGAVDRTA